ncbi:CBS domain-containing protein CBSCBSPB3-like [Gossypium australe]|uniref:CBS domain-containing protein CBSCBSPB3-like n=1 Tax=Gossypium australe TaxID=47621 RepID=A0A5B6W2Z2_9ROSI|nr:CBS domain-containing protein CBSCBSPB3-like [Gossypium australe]
MTSQSVSLPPASRRNSYRRGPSAPEKSHASDNAKPISPSSVGGERTVKKLRLSKALTIPEGTTVSEACRRMAARRMDAVLLTDANGLLSGIITDKDIATRVIAEGLRPEQTVVSKIMTCSPIFVTLDSLAIEALQKMVRGKFRHLPVVENGEVIAMLDITKCLYDAISRMEKAAEQGSAIAAAVEGVERQWGSNVFKLFCQKLIFAHHNRKTLFGFPQKCFCTTLLEPNTTAPYAFIETLRERMFKPSLSTIIAENSKVAVVSSSDPVRVAAKKMRELRVSFNIFAITNFTTHCSSKDILMRVVAQNLSPELTMVEKVMTPNPECAKVETSILDALHIMHDGKFLHLPVLDKDGTVAACVDVLQITHAAISMVESSSGAVNDIASTMMQKFWDSALSLQPPDDYDTQSEVSAILTSEGADAGRLSSYPSLGLGNSFCFKFEDRKGRVHRFNFGIENLDELLSAVMQRIGSSNDHSHPQLLYEDDEGDKVLLITDSDLIAAVNHTRSQGLKRTRLWSPALGFKVFIIKLESVSCSSFHSYWIFIVLGWSLTSVIFYLTRLKLVLNLGFEIKLLNLNEVLRLYLDFPDSSQQITSQSSVTAAKTRWASFHTGLLAGAIVLTSIGVLVYLKRSKL